MKCQQHLVRRNVRLSQFTSMQIGGTAAYFAEPAGDEDLMELMDFAREEGLPWILIGKGSNVIFPDEGYPGLVITLIHYCQDDLFIDRKKNTAQASAGTHLYRFVLACRDQGLGGAEFLANIPGTLGGALVMNAGFSRYLGQSNEIGDLVKSVRVLNLDGTQETIEKKDVTFGYRTSSLSDRIVLGGTLQLWRRPMEDIQDEIRANFDYRNQKQDLHRPSSGSIFKNPGKDLPSAGKLIDQLDLKGTRVGDMMVSAKHSNYFINMGEGKSSDLALLIEKIQKAVLDETGILLETEVKMIQPPPSS